MNQGAHQESQRDEEVKEHVKQYLEKFSQEGLEEVQEQLLDKETVDEKARLFVKGGMKDVELFEELIHQFIMYSLQNEGYDGLSEYAHVEDICLNFMKRVNKLEFAASQFSKYLQFAISVLSDKEVVDSLVRYAFDVIYSKITF